MVKVAWENLKCPRWFQGVSYIGKSREIRVYKKDRSMASNRKVALSQMKQRITSSNCIYFRGSWSQPLEKIYSLVTFLSHPGFILPDSFLPFFLSPSRFSWLPGLIDTVSVLFLVAASFCSYCHHTDLGPLIYTNPLNYCRNPLHFFSFFPVCLVYCYHFQISHFPSQDLMTPYCLLN